MKYRNLLITFIIIIFLLGCYPKERKIEEKPHHGTEGLVLDFVKDAPPLRAYDGEKIYIYVEVRNKGAYPINPDEKLNGMLFLSGFDSSIITIDSHNLENGIKLDDDELKGKSNYNPEGGYQLIKFSGDIKFPEHLGLYIPTFVATACYEYKTTAAVDVCLDPNPLAITERVCEVKDISLTSQGAPVAVTKVEERILNLATENKKVQFKIYIENVGEGDIIKPDEGWLEKCNPYKAGLDLESEDRVLVEEVKLGDKPITCQPLINNYLQLYNGRGFMICESTFKGETAYTTKLLIKLKYAYRNEISKSVRIRRPPYIK